jgi:predicted methyltransferase|tara:strand:- start:763 stop:1167 length:405 start_codon:yes stop_codon:yes gene_type:complete
MKHKANIKSIHKLDKPPFGDGIYTFVITTSVHPEGFVYAPFSEVDKLKYKVGDEVEYEYIKQKNGFKYKDIKKQSMYNNFSKEEKQQYETRLDTGRSILLQVSFKEASQAYLAGKISQDEIASLTNKYFNIIDK